MVLFYVKIKLIIREAPNNYKHEFKLKKDLLFLIKFILIEFF